MITLLKANTKVRAVRDVCSPTAIIRQGWLATLVDVFKNASDKRLPEVCIFLEGKDERGELRFVMADPGDFESCYDETESEVIPTF